jgi:hypothetical protein
MDKKKKMILDGIEAAKKLHFTVVDEDWGETDLHCACAIGCLLVANNVDDLSNANECFKKATEILNVSDDWVQSFIDGFDDNGVAKIATDPEAWTIGHEIRKEVQPIAMSHYILKLEQEEDENG